MIAFILIELAIGYLCFGFYILFKNKNSFVNRIFFSICFHLSCWSFGDAFMFLAPNQSTANLARILSAFGWCFIYCLWLDFTILLNNNTAKWMVNPKRLLIYIPGFFFFLSNFMYSPKEVLVQTNNQWQNIYPLNFFEILYIIYYVTFVILGLLFIYRWGKTSPSVIVKIQAKIIFTTTLITFVLAAFLDGILPILHMHNFFYGITVFPIVIFGIWYSLKKYKLMSISKELVSEYIFESINDPVIIIETDFLIKDANHAAIKILGYGENEIKGMHVQQFIPGTNLNQTAISRFIKAGAIKNLEVELLTSTGTYIPCLISASEIRTEKKHLIGIACVFHDIADRKNAEKILKKAHEELENKVALRTAELKKSNLLLEAEISERKRTEERNQQIAKMESLGTLAGGIAHDFNNILAGIIGYTQLTLEDLTDNPILSDNLSEILKLGDRAKKLISQILTFSRRTIIEPEFVDMNVIISEILKMIKATSSSTIEIIYNFNSVSPFVFADPGEMQQLIMNLCVNAQLAMAERYGILKVSLSEIDLKEDTKIDYQVINKGQYLKIQVSDNGCGMDKSNINRIFEPFYTTRGVRGGTGLGLSVVHGIINSYGGLITVESELNRGSTFSIFFPKAKNPLPNRDIREITAKKTLAKILFIDDEASIVNTTVKILQREGYLVTGLLDGESALKIFNENNDDFDIVITDQSMPGMTGTLFVEKLRALNLRVPVVLCSGYGHEIENEKMRLLNISEFLLKPVSKNQYIAAIEKLLNKKI